MKIHIIPPSPKRQSATRQESDQADEPTANSGRRAFWFGMLLATMLGAFARLLPVLSSDFPILDGGLFFLMAEEIRGANYSLPIETAYNASHVPFAYPPLGFYAAALASDISGAPLLDVVRVLPACFSVLSIPAFYILSRLLLLDAAPFSKTPLSSESRLEWRRERRLQPVFASIAFALLPRSFIWMVMGGGLTRAPGLVFLLLALGQAYLLWTRRRPVFFFSTIACASLTVLSHAELTWTLIYSAAIFWLFFGRSFPALAAASGVALGVAIATFAWWGTVVARHGWSPFRAAASSGGRGWYNWSLDLTSEPLFPLMAVIGLLGFAVCLREKRFLPPFWMVAIFVIQPRSARTIATIPLALMIGVALDRVVFPFAAHMAKTLGEHMSQRSNSRAPIRWMQRRDDGANVLQPVYLRSRTLLFVMACLVSYALLSAWVSGALLRFAVLAPPQRAAMKWSARNTPPNSRFLVLPTASKWASDRDAEWFPVLTRRASIATVQGSEWLPNRRFQQLWREYAVLNSRDSNRFTPDGRLRGEPDERVQNVSQMPRDLAGVELWARQTKADISYIYLPKYPSKTSGPRLTTSSDDIAPWKETERALRASPRYRLIYDREGAVIFQRVGAPKRR